MSLSRWLAHTLSVCALAGTIALIFAARNNRILIDETAGYLTAVCAEAMAQKPCRHDTVARLINVREKLTQFAQQGPPWHLRFGLYRANIFLPALSHAITDCQLPVAPAVTLTLDDISLFRSGEARLTSAATPALMRALNLISLHPDQRVLIAGHTDDSGKPESNLNLSLARARVVRDWLAAAAGLATSHFTLQGLGDTRPLVSNATPEGREKNRRVEITFLPLAAAR